MIVSIDISWVHLHCVAELDERFAIFAFIEVTLSAFKILELAHIGITRTTGKKCRDREKKADSMVFPHGDGPDAFALAGWTGVQSQISRGKWLTRQSAVSIFPFSVLATRVAILPLVLIEY
jgi:hypothetical protein